MVRVDIPETVEELSALSDDINRTEAEQNAKKWARAAAVYRMTKIGKAGRPPKESVKTFTDFQRLTITDFAALKLTGMGSKPTVIAIRAAWEDVCKDLSIEPSSGNAVDIDAEWSDYYGRNAIHGTNAKRAEEAAAYQQFPDGTANAAADEPKWVSNPDGSADRVVEEGVVIHKPSAAEQKERRESPEMAGAYERADVAALSAMIGHATSYLRRAIDKAEEAGLVVPELDIVEDYLLTARNHNNKITNTPEQSRPGLRVV